MIRVGLYGYRLKDIVFATKEYIKTDFLKGYALAFNRENI